MRRSRSTSQRAFVLRDEEAQRVDAWQLVKAVEANVMDG